ncbi:dihydrolipoyllysine-residue acetyltransferase component of pyruvate dehydrogenase complex, mitochondrial [Ciona intestinalis]
MLRHAVVCRRLLNEIKVAGRPQKYHTSERILGVQAFYHCRSLNNTILHHNNSNLITAHKKWSFFTSHVRFYSLPPHTKMLLPALSPTMESGSIVKWEIQEGESFTAGDLLAEIKTDKATVGFEANDDGFMAKIIAQNGTDDIPLGTLVAISVDTEEELAAFKNISVDEIKSDSGGVAAPTTTPDSPSAPTPTTPSTNYPPHDPILLPALSPTMTTGTIVSWEKNVGDKVDEGDSIAVIETDKASMALEYQESGYLAKILLEEGAKDLPLGTPLCVIVTNEEDIPAFANYTATDSVAAAPAAAPTPSAPTPTKAPVSSPGIPPPTPPPATQSGDRLFVSPLAKKLAAEKGIDLTTLAGLGSGPQGRIRAQDLDKAGKVVPAAPAFVDAAPSTPASIATDGSYVDIPLSNIRKVTAKRLCESKQTIPHYYVTVDVEMDKTMALRKSFNKDLEKEGIKVSVNDFLIKASAMACLKVPEANSSWRDTFIRQHNTVDMSIAVSTDTGLITPIVFDANTKGLASISQDVVALAAKAREGKLQPNEFMGGTFTLSNLGMFGVKHFSAIINPPQSCILAVGAARREFVPDSNAENGMREATLVSVTLSCDHRVVDGAVGAQWLQHFKKFIEDPVKMLL